MNGEYDESQIHTATEEELQRLYGSDRLLIGVPVSQDDPDDDVDEQDERQHLVGTFTREEFLGLPDDVEFPQPSRRIMQSSAQQPSLSDEERD